MKAREWIAKIKDGALGAYSHMYSSVKEQEARCIAAIESFVSVYGEGRDVFLFSVPGRTEVMGNHTDHNHGCVLAAAIERDVIAVVSPSDNGVIRLKSEGFGEDTVQVGECGDTKAFADFSSAALIAGTVNGFCERGYRVGGFDAYTTSRVLKGSGLSSSAAFEVMIGNILNHLYNNGEIANQELAKIAQYAENVYFGKPCGLMDQMACAVGGFVFIDFEDASNPSVEPIGFSLDKAGFVLSIVNTGGNHADLNADYASVPTEMKSVAAYFGKDVLRGVAEDALVANAALLRRAVGDRALLRALHFARENKRVRETAAALKEGDIESFLKGVLSSGDSSFKYLQNVYTAKNTEEQGLSLALAVTEGALSGKGCAWRVHGGGFAGTTQAFVRREYAEEYALLMDAVFGEGACMTLSVRSEGAIQICL